MEKEYEDLMQSNFIGKYKGDTNPNLPLKFLTFVCLKMNYFILVRNWLSLE